MINKDIKGLLENIKTNIRFVENGKNDESILNVIESDFLEMLELIKLFLISERDSYYGYFLMNMQYKINFFSPIIAGIKLNSFPPVFETNPLILGTYSLKEILYVVCHEIDHIVLNHPAEMVKANPNKDQDLFYLFNLAADAAVNDRINHEIKAENHQYLNQPEGLITSNVLSKVYKLGKIAKMENYAYYFELIKKKTENQKEDSNDGEKKSGYNQGSGNEGNDNSQEGDSSEADDANTGDPVTLEKAEGKIIDHDWGTGTDEDEAQELVREFVNSSFETMSKESRGLMPGYFLSQVEKINKPAELSWEKILKKYIGTISANKRKTRTRLNRRQPERFDLSGSVDDKILKIVVAIDTSGSVNDRMISRILNEIFEILGKRKHEITIIECDSIVQRVYKARNKSEIKTLVMGRGGTRFSPVIEYVNNDKYYRDALLIYFTDGYGDSKIPKPLTYRNIWVILGGKENLSLSEPYGVVLEMK